MCTLLTEHTMFKSLQFFIFFRFFNSAEVALGGGGQIVTLTGSVKEEGAARALKLLKM